MLLHFDLYADKPSELQCAVQRSDNAAILASVETTCVSGENCFIVGSLHQKSSMVCTVPVLVPFNAPLKSYGDKH
jgi:hypothetical protein